jgi:hypothetical protein
MKSIYPSSFMSQIVAKIGSYLWFIGIVILMFGETIFNSLNIPQPELVKIFRKNYFQSFLLLFFMSSMANSGLATGAFEVCIDDKLYFSKLDSGKVPDVQMIVDILAAAGVPLE